MDLKENKNDLEIEDVSKTETNFRSLYGLTPEVENAISISIENNNKQELVKLISPLHPADQADMLERLTGDELVTAISLLGKALDPEVLVYLDQNVQEKVIDIIGPRALARAIPVLHSDDAVDILQELEEEERKVVIKQLPKADRILVEEALSFPEESAGRLMQREFLAFPSNWTVGQTIDHMRAKPQEEEDSFYSIYVVDPAHRLLGVISLSKLLSAKRPLRLKDLMATSRNFAVFAVFKFIFNFLIRFKCSHSCSLHSANMNKYVLISPFRFNETITLSWVEPFDCSCCHFFSFS